MTLWNSSTMIVSVMPLTEEMIMQTLLGTALFLIPLMGLGFAFLRRLAPILFFYFAMCLIAFGYLLFTGAIEDIGFRALVFATGDLNR